MEAETNPPTAVVAAPMATAVPYKATLPTFPKSPRVLERLDIPFSAPLSSNSVSMITFPSDNYITTF